MPLEAETITRDELAVFYMRNGANSESVAADAAAEAITWAVSQREPEATPLPEGIFGRVELPGYRQHTGWITEETVFGLQMAVIRDWDGRVLAEVALGPGSQVVHLPTPLKRPEPRAALPRGTGWDDGPGEDFDPDEDLDDEDGPAF